jgi:hypothetical protein
MFWSLRVPPRPELGDWGHVWVCSRRAETTSCRFCFPQRRSIATPLWPPCPLRLPLRRLARWPNTMQRASARDCPSPPSSARCDTLAPSTAQTGHGWASNGTIRHAANTLAVTTASTTFKRGTLPPQRPPVLRPPSRVSLVF